MLAVQPPLFLRVRGAKLSTVTPANSGVADGGAAAWRTPATATSGWMFAEQLQRFLFLYYGKRAAAVGGAEKGGRWWSAELVHLLEQGEMPYGISFFN